MAVDLFNKMTHPLSNKKCLPNPSVLAISEKPSRCWFLFYYELCRVLFFPADSPLFCIYFTRWSPGDSRFSCFMSIFLTHCGNQPGATFLRLRTWRDIFPWQPSH